MGVKLKCYSVLAYESVQLAYHAKIATHSLLIHSYLILHLLMYFGVVVWYGYSNFFLDNLLWHLYVPRPRMTATLTYTPATNTVTITDTGTAVAGQVYRLVLRKLTGDTVLTAAIVGKAASWIPGSDGCYGLVLQSGTVSDGVYTVVSQSAVLYHLQVAGNLEKEQQLFAKLSPDVCEQDLQGILQLQYLRQEAAYCLAESNPERADTLLRLTLLS